MSASLENQFISDRYTSLLHLSGSSITAVLDSVHDGLGNATPIQISDARVVIGAGSSIIDVNEDEASVSINNIQLPTASTATTLYDVIFPVNSIYLTVDNINPGTRFTGTVWELVSEGRYLAGVGTGSDINGVSETVNVESNSDNIGEYEHRLTLSEMPQHDHDISMRRRRYGRTNGANKNQSGDWNPDADIHVTTSPEGGGQSHNNTPPYYGVYVWKRTS
jgi:hypothetical protein